MIYYRRLKLKITKYRLILELSRMDPCDPFFGYAFSMFCDWCEENDI